jgi:hypothetical protein
MSRSAKKLQSARAKTAKVQHDLQVASAELGLTHGALQRHVPAEVKKERDVAWAIDQNASLERKVKQAAEELDEVVEVLAEQEVAGGR